MSENKQVMIQISGLKKRYRLGTIGGGTLTADLQSWWAKIRGKEDPNAKIGAKTYGKNETFMALDGIDLTVYKGERLGIIGHNGAGKSTLLKLLSRVTGPTEGEIGLNGRISSMLEVGTGFNPELTGRENIYLNGAILGMTKAEVDKKIDQIIEFSECAKFIDTPVKRYSSGMYVKLAFAVAAHLDSEILVMDEVLAVGDMKFQQKCLGKMSDVSKGEGRTVLYVSHNMNTIRQLCNRCIVLDHGKIIFDGDVEEAIGIYLDVKNREQFTKKDLTDAKRYMMVAGNRIASFSEIELLNVESNIFNHIDILKIRLKWWAKEDIANTCIRIDFKSDSNLPIASTACLKVGKTEKNKENYRIFEVPFGEMMTGKYSANLVLFEKNEYGTSSEIDVVIEAFSFEILTATNLTWNSAIWGHIRLPDTICYEEKE